MISAIISAIVVGAIIGALGRLVVRGQQNVSIVATILIGIVAAVIGTFIARALGVGVTTASTGSNSSFKSPWQPSASRYLLAPRTGLVLASDLSSHGQPPPSPTFHRRRR